MCMRVFYRIVMIASCICLFASCKKKTLFDRVPSSHSRILFANTITETDSLNPIDVVNIYNGGGAGVGDFNNDGLQDLYFTGNQVSSKLYLNKGELEFEDVTGEAGVEGMGRWARGASIVDINNDGLLDIYVCNTLYADSLKRRNILYINQGKNERGVPTFKDMAGEYGLDAYYHSTMANFFDYDNDGDLDMYLTVNAASASQSTITFGKAAIAAADNSTGRLFQNNFDAKVKHAVFTDVSVQAGVNIHGFGHAAVIADINQDGWKDIYVSNDFLSSNILNINNRNGTFTDRAKEYFKHTSYNAMGQDIVDINNDGLADVIELDMSPEDNYRKKMMLNPNSYQSFQNFDYYNYQYQYVRNTLQLNQGPRVGENNHVGSPVFSEIAFMSGIAQTDWSWAPVVNDFDNDGYRDIIITNGFPKDVSDHDFITYRNDAYAVTSKETILKQIPEIKINNYAYRNSKDLRFADVTTEWGIDHPAFSNGAAYVDLDNDGDLDIVVNNIDDEAFVYKNTAVEDEETAHHYLQIRFKGEKDNLNGIGAQAEIFYNQGERQVFENTPYRGYLSTNQCMAHFGLGSNSTIDSLVIKWPSGRKQVLLNVKANQVLTVSSRDARVPFSWSIPAVSNPIFTEVTGAVDIHYTDKQLDFIDFNVQKLLPHKLSEYSPALAVGDIDGNKLDDIIAGGNASFPAQLFLQQPDGKFVQRNLLNTPPLTGNSKDAGLLLFDANGDGTLDLYVSRGGYEMPSNTSSYQDELYLNDGSGNFTLARNALPQNYTSKLCVRSIDYNKDGKQDIFVSGRVDPWNYPKPVSSFVFRNDSKEGIVKFTDVTRETAPELDSIGLVCDAIFSDFDGDGWPDLILAGEWMPLKFFKNNSGKFQDVSATTGLANKSGWWNTIIAGDFRHTGRMDYVVGNVGLNTLFQVSDEFPAYITAKDFDNNGSYAAFPSLYLKDKDGKKREYPMHSRDDVLKQMITLKKRFTNYKLFANATMNDVLSAEQRDGALRLSANELRSCFLRNDGNGKFTAIPLPMEAQMSVLNGMLAEDVDGDSNLDLIINGNDYGTDVSIGRYDALNGLVMKGNGRGQFKPVSMLHSGIYIPGNGKALVKLRSASNKLLIAASQNKDVLKVFRLNRNVKSIDLEPNDLWAMVKYRNGKLTKHEFYYGASFLSQSGRFVNLDENVAEVVITNDKGVTRTVL